MPRYKEATETALKVLDVVTGHSVFRSVTSSGIVAALLYSLSCDTCTNFVRHINNGVKSYLLCIFIVRPHRSTTYMRPIVTE